MKKPVCKLIGANGNVFNLIGLAKTALKKAGMTAEASEMTKRCFAAGSYGEALSIIQEYVTVR